MAKSTGATTDGIARILDRVRDLEGTVRTLTAGSPLKSASIGSGGIRLYDEGRIILDGEDLKVLLRVINGSGFISMVPTNRSGLRADPAFWGDEGVFVVAGPLRDESTAGEGFGGSNLFLNPTYARLIAGEGGPTSARVDINDAGGVFAFGSHARFQMHPDGALDIGNDTGMAVQVGAGGGRINVWAGTGQQIALNSGVVINSNLDVTGTKNFLTDHPARPGHVIRYGATESPVSGIEDHGTVTTGPDGTTTIEWAEHYAALLKAPPTLHLTAYGPGGVWCEPPTIEGATIHAEPGTTVAWLAKGERTGADFVVVEEGTTEVPSPESTTTEEESA